MDCDTRDKEYHEREEAKLNDYITNSSNSSTLISTIDRHQSYFLRLIEGNHTNVDLKNAGLDNELEVQVPKPYDQLMLYVVAIVEREDELRKQISIASKGDSETYEDLKCLIAERYIHKWSNL